MNIFRTLLLGLFLLVATSAQNYLVNATKSPLVYVSAVSFGGIPAGSASGDGSVDRPYLTCDQGYANTPLTAGGTVLFNGDAANPTLYQCSTAATVTKIVTFKAVNPKGAILAGTGTNRSFEIAVTDGSLVIFQDVIIDPSQNSGGPAARCIDMDSATAALNVKFVNVLLRGWTQQCLYNPSAMFRANITSVDTDLSTTSASACISLTNYDAGGFSALRGSCTITAQNLSGAGGVLVYARNTGVTARFTNFNLTQTLDPTLTGAGIHFGIQIVNVAGAIIDGGTHQCLGAPGARQCYLDSISTNIGSGSAELPIDGGIIRNVTGINTTNGGILFLLGEDNGSRSKAVGMRAEDLVGTGSASAAAGGLHGVVGLNVTDTVIQRVSVTTTGVALGFKTSINSVVQDSFATDATSLYMVAKGGEGNFYRNTLTARAGFSGNMYASEDDTPGSGDHTTSSIVQANHFVVNGAASIVLVRVDPSNAATFIGNDYHLASGTVNASPWRRQGTLYASFGNPVTGWITIDPAATSNIPRRRPVNDTRRGAATRRRRIPRTREAARCAA